MGETGLRFEVLGSQHLELRSSFTCGVDALDDYLRRRGRKEMAQDLAVVHILYDAAENRIAGYFTLSSASVELRDLPHDLTRKLPAYKELPATLIGRLARDVRYRGKDIGDDLLRRALELALAQSSVSASFAVIVDAKDDSAARFYVRYGFRPLANHERRLYIPMASLRKAEQYSREV